MLTLPFCVDAASKSSQAKTISGAPKAAVKQDDTTAQNSQDTLIELEVGHAHILKVRSARQVAVGNSQTLQANAANSTEVILFGKQAGSTTVDVWDQKGRRQSYQVHIQPAGRKQMLAQIRDLLGEDSAVTVRSTANHIVLQGDTVSSVERSRIERILTHYPDVLDITGTMNSDPMVMLDVLVIELPTHRLTELGVRWQADEASGSVGGLSWNAGRALAQGADVDANAATGTSRVQSWAGVSSILKAQVQSMADRGEAVLLAQPQLVTRAGKTATFLAGGEVPYSLTDGKGRAHTEFKKYGVALSVTPEIGAQGRVVASVEVEVSAIDPSITTPAGPAMRMRKATTQLSARSGQTVVLAGFMSHERSNSYRGTPTPKNAVFDFLTGVNEERERQTELAIVVTPVIVTAEQSGMRERARQAQVYAEVEVADKRRLSQASVIEDGWYSEPAAESQGSSLVSTWQSYRPAVMPAQWNLVPSHPEQP